MRHNLLIRLVWPLAASALLTGCATQGGSAPMSASAYRAGPESGVGAWTHGREAGQIKETLTFPSTYAPGEIVVSFGDRHLYYVEARGRALSYPIAIPREQDRWEGVTTISDKKINPSWIPTADMMRENPRLPSYVPGGHPMNPLGVRALYLGTTTYRIHGTDAPWTIGDAASKGCIRMFNEHVLDLYERVGQGARVTVTWSRFASTS
jgi:lipoprotein-anchoring transpeptidase ErfK/SrfK